MQALGLSPTSCGTETQPCSTQQEAETTLTGQGPAHLKAWVTGKPVCSSLLKQSKCVYYKCFNQVTSRKHQPKCSFDLNALNFAVVKAARYSGEDVRSLQRRRAKVMRVDVAWKPPHNWTIWRETRRSCSG